MSELESDDIWRVIGDVVGSGGEGVVVTIVAAKGSIPGTVGAKALVGESGIQVGNLGGGKVEAAVIRKVSEVLLGRGVSAWMETWNLQRDLGMTCGGEVTFLFERVGTPSDWHVVVFGAGHVAQALVPLLASLPCRIDVVDPRPQWLSRIRPNVSVKTHDGGGSYLGAADQLVTEESQVLCITQGHQTDFPIVQWVLNAFPDIAFLGVIGSEVKRAKLLGELRDSGISDGLLERLTCPIGLPIGGNLPAEIAVSIAAQLLEKRVG
jgi:xanthine dehydrogenase accessory factor